ncbi:MAG: cysteine--tRNA ligase [Treponema sp.]|nr:cysteine--tRNA ligase [Treponema sp.]
MPLRLYNTLGRKTEEFIAQKPGEAGFYGCGPTVYNYAHIGNLRAYVTHDILTRVLRERGYTVNHVMNITDVGHLSGDSDSGEDKMVKSAAERGKTVLEIADFYTQAFYNDTDRMNIIRPNIVCKATEHIPEMIELIKRIEKNGFTYNAGGNLYFDISRFTHYGELALHRMEDLKTVARTEIDDNKRNPGDFVLWFTKSKFENQALVWDSPWGRGYPGWHIECSAMSIKYLGEQFDIHAGGIDHVPIHHTNEIAQSEAATGKHPWVRYWIHNEFLVLDKGKMSKSTGEFLTLQSLIDQGYDPLDYRYMLVGGHYRSQLQFSWDSLESARNSRKSLLEKIKTLAAQVPDTIRNNMILNISRRDTKNAEESAKIANCDQPSVPPCLCESSLLDILPDSPAAKRLAAFNEALDDDISTPRALAELWGLLRDTEAAPADALKTILYMDRVLGLRLETALAGEQETPEFIAEIEGFIAQRQAAKAVKDFKLADKIRNDLNQRGIILEDTKNGSTWRRKT